MQQSVKEGGVRGQVEPNRSYLTAGTCNGGESAGMEAGCASPRGSRR